MIDYQSRIWLRESSLSDWVYVWDKFLSGKWTLIKKLWYFLKILENINIWRNFDLYKYHFNPINFVSLMSISYLHLNCTILELNSLMKHTVKIKNFTFFCENYMIETSLSEAIILILRSNWKFLFHIIISFICLDVEKDLTLWIDYDFSIFF